jgi:hypothetical protein
MENEDRLFARFVDFYRTGYERYVRFMCIFYGGEPAAKAADLAHQTSQETLERAP